MSGGKTSVQKKEKDFNVSPKMYLIHSATMKCSTVLPSSQTVIDNPVPFSSHSHKVQLIYSKTLFKKK